MKRYNYDRNDTIKQAPKLPPGGYVCVIMEAKEGSPYSDGTVPFIVSFDIAEGDQKKFYEYNYKTQRGEDKKWKGTYRLAQPKEDGTDDDAFRKRKMNTFFAAVEDSNSGYHWDWNEAGLKGKLFGGVFGEKEYDFNGRIGFYTTLRQIVTVEEIRKGDFKIPDPLYLQKKEKQPAGEDVNDFVNVEEDGDLPFA